MQTKKRSVRECPNENLLIKLFQFNLLVVGGLVWSWLSSPNC